VLGPASKFSHTMSVSTAPISKHVNVSRTPNTYLPESRLQGLTLVQVRAQLEQLQDTFMS
jgi:hypothetical protein